MSEVAFDVSARTARLIGQENFANADGAIIELVKNSYDADANNVIIIFDLPFRGVPEALSEADFKFHSEINGLVRLSYKSGNDNSYFLRTDSEDVTYEKLENHFRGFNSLYIIDDGEGMDDKVIRTKWMKIGTDNKLVSYKSDGGRIKTGAKGIGRFALDRLGERTEIRTIPQEGNMGYEWLMDWKQFENSNLSLSEIKAELNRIENFNLEDEVAGISGTDKVSEILGRENADFSSGTIIKISGLRDEWDNATLNKLFKTLESLIPPKELGMYNIDMYLTQELESYGEVSTAFFNDFDYKVESKFIAEKLSIKFSITRKELSVKKIEKSYKHIFLNKTFPYDISTLKKEEFSYEKSIYKVLKIRREEETDSLFKKVGDFQFTFYFTKLQSPSKKNKEIYPYRDKSYTESRVAFEEFGGIKIYRDHFRVRPYGEPSDDWLDLGRRQAGSPASAAQRIGDWKVRAKQIAGVIDISRVNNPGIKDKSDRSALIENDYFVIFKNIVTGIINEFEYDRSKILNLFYRDDKEKERIRKEKEEREQAIELRKKAEELAKQIFNAQNQELEDNRQLSKPSNIQEQAANIIAEGFENLPTADSKEVEQHEKDVELRWLRSLASLGLIVVSLDHELKAIRNNLDPRIRHLTKHLKALIPKSKLDELKSHENPIKLIDFIKEDHKKLKGWLDYALNAIKLDKRKRRNLNFGNYFEQFKNNWKFALRERNVTLTLRGNKSNKNIIRAFEIDMDSIFNNLLTNSFEAFKLRREKYDRVIEIEWSFVKDQIEVTYKDNGVGMADVFEDPYDIFKPFVTTKKDKRGNETGTGLGMYIVNNVIEDYEGEKELMFPEQGFMIKFWFKTRKQKKNE